VQGPRQIPPGRGRFHRPPRGINRSRVDALSQKETSEQRHFSRKRRPTANQLHHVAEPPPTHWLYLHGFGSSPKSQKAAFFRSRFETVRLPIIVPDLNVPSFEDLTISAALEAIDSVLNELPSGATVGIVGSSLGGYLALLTAGRHTHVRRLLLMAPALGLFRTNFVGLGHVGLKRWMRDGYIEVFHHETQSNRRISSAFVQDAKQYDENRLRLGIPITIVHGTRDDMVDPHLSVLYAKHNSNVVLHLVEDDHSLLTSTTQIWDWLWRDIRPTVGDGSDRQSSSKSH